MIPIFAERCEMGPVHLLACLFALDTLTVAELMSS